MGHTQTGLLFDEHPRRFHIIILIIIIIILYYTLLEASSYWKKNRVILRINANVITRGCDTSN